MPDTVYKRVAAIMEADIGGERVVLDPKADNSFGFNPVARTVWQSLEQPKSFAQLRDELLAQFEVGNEQCAVELQQLLDDLIGEGLIESCPSRPHDTPAIPATSDFTPPGVSHRSISREFSFLVECCRWRYAPDHPPRVEALGGPLDWPLFVRLARFHRVQGLAAACLSRSETDIPAEVADRLGADAASIAAANLVAAAESRNLLGDFDRAGVPLLFVKGLTVGALAYGNASVKAAVDIDLLVPESHIVDAAEVLQDRGYCLVIPDRPADPERLRAWHRRRKESLWSRSNLHIDLHSRLSDNRRLIPSIGLDSPRQWVEVASGIRLPTLARDELFAYLCVHGASSAWFRLKWISDLAGLVHGQSGETIERLYESSQALGAHRAAGQALLLADRLYGSLRETDLRAKLAGDRATRRLAQAAYAQLTGRPREPTSVRFGTWRIHLTQFALKRGLRFKLSEFTRQTRDAAASLRRRPRVGRGRRLEAPPRQEFLSAHGNSKGSVDDLDERST